jgi:hypothetical protein
MADVAKPRDGATDPEKLEHLRRDTTVDAGEVRDTIFKHADPNDGDEA